MSWLFREKQQRSFDGFFCADDVSTAFPWEFETLEGPNMPASGGLQAIAEMLASTVDIRFDHFVTNIEWNPDGVCISCANGVDFQADAVMMTTSIGVLQAQHQSLFTPQLPSWKQMAISAVRLGVVDKIFVEFELDEAPTTPPFAPEPPSRQSSIPLSVQGGEVWNMGRRIDDSAAAERGTTAALAISGKVVTAPRPPGRGQRPHRRSKPCKTIHTYAFMWPVPEPLSLGESGRAKAQALLPGGITHVPGPGKPLSDLPTWLYGLHSIRFHPGPCWIEPSEKELFSALESGRDPDASEEKSNSLSAVLWITGEIMLFSLEDHCAILEQ